MDDQEQKQQPESPFHPFNDSIDAEYGEYGKNHDGEDDGEDLKEAFHDTFQEQTDGLHMHLVETNIAPMPTTLPPPPPITPPRNELGTINFDIANGKNDGEKHEQMEHDDQIPTNTRMTNVHVNSPTLPMPNTPPPTPPVHQKQAAAVPATATAATRAIIPEELPPMIPETGTNTDTHTAAGETTTKKSKLKKKKSKKGEKKKKKGSKKFKYRNETNGTRNRGGGGGDDEEGGNGKTNGNVGKYQQQYNTMQGPVSYQQETKEKVGGLFSSIFNPDPSHVKSMYPSNKPENNNINANVNAQSQLQPQPQPQPQRRFMRVNIGVVNSADGEGTTIPQLLHRMRVMTLSLSALTIAFEAWAMIFNTIFLKADKVILGCYLLFFVGLLLCFELVRGTPKAHKVSMMGLASRMMSDGRLVNGGRGGGGGGGMTVNEMQDAAAEMADVVWRNALEERWARRLRYFLQDNFGIFYSCLGRAFFFLIIGGMAFGQNFFMIQLIGIGFMLMGLWLITLRVRYPALDKALVMDLEHEFGHRRPDSALNQHNDDNESVVTWTSIRGNIGNSSSSTSEQRSLLSSIQS